MEPYLCDCKNRCPGLPSEGYPKKAGQDGEVKERESVDDLGLGWEVGLGIRGESKTLKRAEAV
jgi:hypothetical protein